MSGVLVSRLRHVVLFATAAAGLVGGHLLGYLFLASDGAARRSILAQTGHGYLSKAVALAAGAAIIAGIAASALGAARAQRVVREPSGLRGIFVPLAVLQGTAFVALETGERLLAGASLTDLAGPVVIGLPLQATVALVAGLLLAALAGTVEAVVRALTGPRLQTQSSERPIPVPTWWPAHRRVVGDGRLTRAPPFQPGLAEATGGS